MQSETDIQMSSQASFLNLFGVYFYPDKNKKLQLELQRQKDSYSEIVQTLIVEPLRFYQWIKKTFLKTFFPTLYRETVFQTLNNYHFGWLEYLVCAELKEFWESCDPDTLTKLQSDTPDENGEFVTASKNRIVALKQHLFKAELGLVNGIEHYPDIPLELLILDTSQKIAFEALTGITVSHFTIKHNPSAQIKLLEKSDELDRLPDWATSYLTRF